MPHPSVTNFDALTQETLTSHPLLFSRIAKALEINGSEAPIYFKELLKFLALISFHQKHLTPAYKIDLAWHEFILFTRLYTSFCDTHFDRYIHHSPGGKDNENEAQFKQTILLYEETYGKLPLNLWGVNNTPIESSCGPCES